MDQQLTPWDLLRADAVRRYMQENPQECKSVLDAVVTWLEVGNEEFARRKIKLDSDKFSDRKKVLTFLNSIELLDDEYKARMIRAGVIS